MSPIDLSLAHSVPLTLPDLERRHFDRIPMKAKITNNGWTVVFSGKWESTRPYICGGPLRDKYVFYMLHFHWAENDAQGSEHTADGQEFPLEMHVVYFKAKYKYYEEAVKHHDGVIFEVHFFYIQPDDNKNLNKIIRHMDSITKAGTSFEVEAVPLKCIFFPFTGDYLMYAGRIIARNGGYKVLWLISRRTSGISHRQMIGFRTISGKDGRSLLRNIHYLYDIGNRRIYHVNMSQYLIGALYPYPRGFTKGNNKLHIQFRKISLMSEVKNKESESSSKLTKKSYGLRANEDKNELTEDSESEESIERNKPNVLTETKIKGVVRESANTLKILQEKNAVVQNINTLEFSEGSEESFFSKITEFPQTKQDTCSLCSNCKNIKKKIVTQPPTEHVQRNFERRHQQVDKIQHGYSANMRKYQMNWNSPNSYNNNEYLYGKNSEASERMVSRAAEGMENHNHKCVPTSQEQIHFDLERKQNAWHASKQVYNQGSFLHPLVKPSNKSRPINRVMGPKEGNNATEILEKRPVIFCPLHNMEVYNAPIEGVHNREVKNKHTSGQNGINLSTYNFHNEFPTSQAHSIGQKPAEMTCYACPHTKNCLNVKSGHFNAHEKSGHSNTCGKSGQLNSHEKNEHFNTNEKREFKKMKMKKKKSKERDETKKKPSRISVKRSKKKSNDKIGKQSIGKSSSPLNIKITPRGNARRKESFLASFMSAVRDVLTLPQKSKKRKYISQHKLMRY